MRKIMDKHSFFLLLFLALYGCHVPTEIKVPEKAKPADEFARQFVDNIITGRIDSSFAEIDPELLNDAVKRLIINANHNINGAQVKSCRVVGLNWTSHVLSSKKITVYKLGYEYQFDNKDILFTASVREDKKKFSIIAFNGQFLPAPLSELAKFTFRNKSMKQYVFLLFVILIPVFILISFIALLTCKISTKEKIIWALIILLVAIPQFLINWNTGQMDFKLLNVSLLGAGAGRSTLYSPWILSFSIPIGAILFWIKRKGLIEAEQDSKYYEALAAEVESTGGDLAESGSSPQA